MYTKNIDPSVSHTVNLCKNFQFWCLDVQFVKGLWSCNFEDTVSYNSLMMLVGPWRILKKFTTLKWTLTNSNYSSILTAKTIQTCINFYNQLKFFLILNLKDFGFIESWYMLIHEVLITAMVMFNIITELYFFVNLNLQTFRDHK